MDQTIELVKEITHKIDKYENSFRKLSDNDVFPKVNLHESFLDKSINKSKRMPFFVIKSPPCTIADWNCIGSTLQ